MGTGKYPHLSDYLHLLEEWKVSHAPKMPDEEWKAEFIETCQQTEKINYYLDLLVFGELQDRIEFLLDSGKDVKRIEERMEEYRRNNKEQTGRSIGSEGNTLIRVIFEFILFFYRRECRRC